LKELRVCRVSVRAPDVLWKSLNCSKTVVILGRLSVIGFTK
jgi:hypothetical protein